jgi:hypothetical protein
MQSNRQLLIILSSSILILIPLIAMQFTNEVNWTLSDFVVAAILLQGTGLMCEFVLKNVAQLKYRIAICGILIFTLIIMWAELAGGIIGTPFGGN